METCEVCGREGKEGQHPCRFEVACSCWYGIACTGTGKIKTEQRHTQAALRGS